MTKQNKLIEIKTQEQKLILSYQTITMESTNEQQNQQQRMSDLMTNLGQDHMGWTPAFTDYKQLLEQLKSEDEMNVYQATMNLQQSLSVAQENTLQNFTLDQYIPALIDILKRPPLSDLSNEVNMMAIQCLTNLMDIFPSICNSIINHGGVKCLTELFERNMGFIDLNEACIKAFEKISYENPYAILTSGAMALCLNMMDFFEMNTQKRIIQLVANVSRHSASEQDFDNFILPIMPILNMLLAGQNEPGSQQRTEALSHIIIRICDSFQRFYNHLTQFDKVTLLYQKLAETGIFENVQQGLQIYSVLDQKQSEEKQGKDSQGKSLTATTVQNYLKVLTLCCRFSGFINKQLIDQNIFEILNGLLPSQEDQKKHGLSSDQYPFTLEVISFLDTLLPERDSSLKQGEQEKTNQQVEKQKRENFVKIEQAKIVFLAEKILPKIFFVYDNNISLNIRLKTLQIIDKMISLFNEELLNNFIEPYSFAKFIYANISSGNPNSVYICLQMIQKLLISNSKTYTLPMIREGVVEHIKKLSVKEQLEEAIQPKSEEERLKLAQFEEEANLLQAKAMLLGQQPADESQRAHFESVLQKYMEHQKLSKQALQQKIQKGSGESNQKILELAQILSKEYFENEQFMSEINSHCQEEFQLFEDLKKLSQQLLDEAQKINFDHDQNKTLMAQLQTYLTSNRNVMLYEFKQSGLLEALNIYLTSTPNQAKFLIEQKKAHERGEELKRSEEMQINTMSKEGKKVSKKEGRCFVQRLKMFSHFLLNEKNAKRGINDLVQLCHDLLSQSENIIFEGQMGAETASHQGVFGFQADINQSVSALKQLTRRIRVNLVYDQDKKQLKQIQEQQLPPLQLETPTQEQLAQNTSPQFESKARSHNPAFSNLGALSNLEQNKQSKVYMKRNILYSELKQVLIAVEQCASLYLLEDFLRNKIKSMDDVRNLKAPQSFLESIQKTAKQENPISNPQRQEIAREFMDKAMLKMRIIFESAPGTRTKEENDEFANQLAEEIVSVNELSEGEQETIIRHLEHQAVQMMDDLYAQEDQALDEMRNSESYDERLMSQGNEEELVEAESKIYEFQRMIDKLRTLLKEKQQNKKLQKEKDAKEKPKEEEKKQEQTLKEIKEEPKKEVKNEEDEQKDQEMEDQSEDPTKKEEENQVKDVEMTDEEDESRKFIEQHQKMLQRQLNRPQEIDLKQGDENPDQGISEDLEELIKANGEDIEFEFHAHGHEISPTLTLFEIQKQAGPNMHLTKQPQKISHHYHLGSDTLTLYFSIRDKKEEIQISKRDSIDMLSARRERTKSEAVDDISTSSINSIVQQLIEKEFNVFSKDLQEKLKQKKFKNEEQLEQCLKILKVVNFICKNIQLFTNQGLKFLINSTQSDEEVKEKGFSDMDLFSSLSSIHPKLFHHHKLDTFILKNIQDPFTLMGGTISESLQQIFRNCPFLFPFQTRELFFKLISFIGPIDMNRSIYFLREFIKARGGRLGGEDKSGIKFQKQKVSVERNKIIESAIALTKKMNKRAFIEFEFKDEEGTGLGPTLEFYSLLAEELKTKMSDIWRKLGDNTLFPSPLQMQKISNDELQKVYELFRVMGVMVAKSIIDDRLIDLPISPVWWDILLGKKMNIFDLDRIDSHVYKVIADLQQLANKKREIDKRMNLDEDSKLRQIHSLKTNVHYYRFNAFLQSGVAVEDLGLYFVLPGYENIELRQEGKETQVTIHNIQDYIDLLLNFVFHETIKLQTSAFKKGFNSIFPIDCLKPFSTIQELEEMICGTSTNEEEWKSPQRLMENIIPDHGYHQKSFEYQNFIRFITEMENPIERRKFLKFVTGSPRLPNGGFSALQPKLTLVLRKEADPMKNPDHTLPSVMTCQNYLKMPRYSSFEVLKKQFETAYNEGNNNFTLS